MAYKCSCSQEHLTAFQRAIHHSSFIALSCYRGARENDVIAVFRSKVPSYLITPRSDDSMNRTSRSTSASLSSSARNFSSACEVLSFEASSSLKA